MVGLTRWKMDWREVIEGSVGAYMMGFRVILLKTDVTRIASLGLLLKIILQPGTERTSKYK